jgi:nucleotide-binding universal stress UspA family protein
MFTSNGPEKIVLATDGSKYAEAAVDATIALARGSRAEVRVVHVWNLDIRQRHSAWDVEVRSEARHLLDATVERLTKAGIHAEGAILRADSDHVAAAVVTTAKTFDADLVVIGSRGLYDWQSILDQRVSHQLMSVTDCPLVMVRGRTTTARPPQRVLLAVAGGDDITRAARAAIAVASAPDCLVVVGGCLDQYPGGMAKLAAEWKPRRKEKPVAKAIEILTAKFASVDSFGSQQLVEFHNSSADEIQAMQARRAYELVQAFLALI